MEIGIWRIRYRVQALGEQDLCSVMFTAGSPISRTMLHQHLLNEWKEARGQRKGSWEGLVKALSELSFGSCGLRFIGESWNQFLWWALFWKNGMEEHRKYLSKEKSSFVKFWFQIHTQHCNVKYISYWLLKNKKERKGEKGGKTFAWGYFKADSQAQGRTSGIRISGILHFEHVPLGIPAGSKLWSLQSENHCGAWNLKQFNSHGRADQQISSRAFPWLCPVWEVGGGEMGGCRRRGTRTGI